VQQQRAPQTSRVIPSLWHTFAHPVANTDSRLLHAVIDAVLDDVTDGADAIVLLRIADIDAATFGLQIAKIIIAIDSSI
jgi:hypothetical protein